MAVHDSCQFLGRTVASFKINKNGGRREEEGNYLQQILFLKKKRKIRIAGEIEISKLESKLLIESLQGRLSFSLLLESPSSSSAASNHFQHWKTSSPFWVSRKSFCHLYAWLTIYSSEVSCTAHALMPDWKGGWVL